MSTSLGSGVLPDAAFAAMFEEQADRVLRLAFLLGAADPEDVAQEAFCKLYAARHRLTDRERAVSYLNRIVANEVRGRHRTRQVMRRRQHLTRVPEAVDPLGSRPEQLAVLAALGQLGARHREVVVLRYWLDLPLAEIAAVTGLRLGTVKSTLSRALTRLAPFLSDPAPADETTETP